MSTSVVRIEAAPAPVEINFHSTAFLVVDMQPDVVTDGGLQHRSGVDGSTFQRVVASTARALIAARAAGMPVVYVKMGPGNTGIIRELAPWPEDTVVDHHRITGFFETTLHDTLRRLGAKHLIVTGYTTSAGVESTIRDATCHGYAPVLLADCTADDASLLLVERRVGPVSTSEAFVKALRRTYADWNAGDLQLR